jgi:fatty-acyl-CoA synthase
MLSGAAPISRQTMELYWRRGVRLMNGYGMTEIGPNNLVPPVGSSLAEIEAKWNSAGKPLFFNDVRIVDQSGNDVPTGVQGELIWRGPLCYSGYWQNEAASRAAVKDGWIYSGDVGYKDEDGYYYICGRLKNMFITGGENIFPTEIEEALCKHAEVKSACVIGVPDKRWGEVGKALIVRREGTAVTKTELLAHVTSEISRIKVPVYVKFVDEIPHNAVGKTDLVTIKNLYGTPDD